jgi:hypothetical protein
MTLALGEEPGCCKILCRVYRSTGIVWTEELKARGIFNCSDRSRRPVLRIRRGELLTAQYPRMRLVCRRCSQLDIGCSYLLAQPGTCSNVRYCICISKSRYLKGHPCLRRSSQRNLGHMAWREAHQAVSTLLFQ